MDRLKDDNYYLEKILKSINRIVATISGTSYEEFVKDEDVQDIAMFNLIQISENAKKLSSKYKEEYPNIPWNDIYGLRNRIVHDYGNVLLDTVYYTLVDDIPELAAIISKCFK